MKQHAAFCRYLAITLYHHHAVKRQRENAGRNLTAICSKGVRNKNTLLVTTGSYVNYLIANWLSLMPGYGWNNLMLSLLWYPATYIYMLLLLLSRFSCVRLSATPIDGSPPGSPVPGLLQARTLEWVAISFSGSFTVVSDLLNRHMDRTSFPQLVFPGPSDHFIPAWGIRVINLVCRILDFQGTCNPCC